MSDVSGHARADVILLGGGIAGMWTLHVLLAHGYDAWLVESRAIGAGQSVQAQGIVHGGGKYALRKVADRQSVRAIRDMPDRWRRHRSGDSGPPDLRAASTLSEGCWLWLPRGSWRSYVQAWGLLPILKYGGLLACPPVEMPRTEWPEPLLDSALRAYRMAEPVLDTRSVLQALAEPVRDRLLLVTDTDRVEDLGLDRPPGDDGRRRILLRSPTGESLDVAARALVFTAGAGNDALMRAVGGDAQAMQRRPLRMALLAGALPPLFGHCISGGRTRITVTSADLDTGERVWQVGGEVAERHADGPGGDAFRRDVVGELRACLPGLELSGLRFSSYAAVRAEGRNAAQRRPTGVQVQQVAPGAWVAWPTKWAMAPLLAAEILRELVETPIEPGGPQVMHGLGGWPCPEIAPFPWEDVEWSSIPSV